VARAVRTVGRFPRPAVLAMMVAGLAAVSATAGGVLSSGPSSAAPPVAAPQVAAEESAPVWVWPEPGESDHALRLSTPQYQLALEPRTGILTVSSAAGSYALPLAALVGRLQLPPGTRFLPTTDGSNLDLYVVNRGGQLLERALLRPHRGFFTVTFSSQLGPDNFAVPAFFSNGRQGLPAAAVVHAFSPDPVSQSLIPSPTTYLGVHPPYHTAPFAPPPLDLQFKLSRGWAGVGLVQVPDATALSIDSQSQVTVNYPLRLLAGFPDTGAGGAVAPPRSGPGKPLAGSWLEFPSFVFTAAPDQYSGLYQYHLALSALGMAPTAAPPGRRPSWWSWPMVDTWGQQLLTGAARSSPRYTAAWVLSFASQWRQQFHVRHFTLVIDAQWQARLGDPTPSTRFGGFSGMKALIARLHSEGIRVMLWWKLWTDQLPDGKVVRYDPTQPGFTTLLSSQVDQMVGPGPSSLGADGLKLDWGFLVPPPTAEQLARPQLGMGAAVLLRYMRILSSAAWHADPASLIDASAVAPQFGGTEDTLRLYDAHRASTWSYRAAIVSAVDPNSAIDGDGWALLSSQAIPHIVASSVFGIPSIYYVGRWAKGTRFAPGLARDLGMVIQAAQSRGQGRAVPTGTGWEYVVAGRVSARTLANDRAIVVYRYSPSGRCLGATVVSAVEATLAIPGCSDLTAVTATATGDRPVRLGRTGLQAEPGVPYRITFAQEPNPKKEARPVQPPIRTAAGGHHKKGIFGGHGSRSG
jgi:hypothetical protein